MELKITERMLNDAQKFAKELRVKKSNRKLAKHDVRILGTMLQAIALRMMPTGNPPRLPTEFNEGHVERLMKLGKVYQVEFKPLLK